MVTVRLVGHSPSLGLCEGAGEYIVHRCTGEKVLPAPLKLFFKLPDIHLDNDILHLVWRHCGV